MPAKGPAPAYFELAFGMKRADADPRSTEQPLELSRERAGEREVAYVRGQIDRVDASEDGVLVAYDYKLSHGPGRADMEQGRDTQLGLYLAAIEQLFSRPGDRVAGGGYYALRITAD